MCTPKINMPAIGTPPAAQALSMPGASPTQRRKPAGGLAGGTLLTGPTGIASAAATGGANTLLGA